MGLGIVYASILLVRTAWSWRLAPVCPYRGAEPREAAVWEVLVRKLAGIAPRAADWVAGGPSDRLVLIAASWLPEALLSLCFVGLLAWLHRNRLRLDDGTLRTLRRFGMVYIGVAFWAVPMQVQDFWISIAWGRVVLCGIDPYTTHIHELANAEAILRGLPLDADLPGMTYGPLWALISAALCAIGKLLPWPGWGEALLFKGVLALSWIGVIRWCERALAGRPLWHRAVGLAIAAWLPLGPIQSVSEGHNDALVTALVAG
ncbi:MAG: hypothetical protein R3E12_08705 [Candidatus Eisenbacteria bacterium]